MVRHQHLHRLPVKKNPRHIRECALDQWQAKRVPGIEFDEQMFFSRNPPLAERVQQQAQPDYPLVLRNVRALQMRAKNIINRLGLGNDYVLRQRRQHLRKQSRAAAGHVKDKTRRRNAGAGIVQFLQGLDGRFPLGHVLVGMRKTLPDGLPEKRRGEAHAAEVTPVHLEPGGGVFDARGYPTVEIFHPIIQLNRKAILSCAEKAAGCAPWLRRRQR